MKAKPVNIALLIITLMAAVTSSALGGDKPPKYELMLVLLQEQDTTIDFTYLRLAYAQSSGYDPYNADIGDLRSSMYEDYVNGDINGATKNATFVLDICYLDIEAHMLLEDLYRNTGDSVAAAYHFWVADGLIGAILDSGDGTSPESAFYVLNTREEYVILDMMGYDLITQSLVPEDDHTYDVMSVKDRDTGMETEVYFNIDFPFSHLAKSFE